MIDPEHARQVLREYHETAPLQKLIDDTRRYSPELADHLGLPEQPVHKPARAGGGFRDLFASFGRSIHKLFS